MHSMLKLGKEKPHCSGLLYEWINYCTMALQSFTSSSFFTQDKINVLLFSPFYRVFFVIQSQTKNPFQKKKKKSTK